MRVLVWNCKVGRPTARVKAGLLALIALTWPKVILLQEAKRFGGNLPGYQRFDAKGLSTDSENCIAFVRKGLAAKGYPVPVNGPRWRHDRVKPSRVFYAVGVDGITFVTVHRCTKGMDGENKYAWAAEHNKLREFAEGHERLVLAGDWNAFALRKHPTSPRSLAEEIGAEVVTASPGIIDYALVRGVKARVKRLKGKFGSDHRPFVLTVK